MSWLRRLSTHSARRASSATSTASIAFHIAERADATPRRRPARRGSPSAGADDSSATRSCSANARAMSTSPAADRRLAAQHSLCRARAARDARLHGDGRADARARHRRQQRRLLGDRRRAAAAAALSRRRSAGAADADARGSRRDQRSPRSASKDWNRLNTTFEAISGYFTSTMSSTRPATLPERSDGRAVTPRFLDVWGVRAGAGPRLQRRRASLQRTRRRAGQRSATGAAARRRSRRC